MHCDEVIVDIDEDEFPPGESPFHHTTERGCLPHHHDTGHWKLSDHLPDEKAEVGEASDPMTDHGTLLGQAGNGRTPFIRLVLWLRFMGYNLRHCALG